MQPDPKNTAPTAQKAEGVAGSHAQGGDVSWLRRAQAAYLSSTTYIDANQRKGWEDSIKAFNSQHPGDSKYNNAAYDKRSKLFRPKPRAIMRKNEAAAAAAFFSNMEVVDIKPGDGDDKVQQANAEIMKCLMEYRLTKSIPWYQTVLGGLQDAQTIGVVCAHVWWDYRVKQQVQAAVVQATPLHMTQDEEYPAQQDLPEGTLVAEDAATLAQPAKTLVEGAALIAPKVLADKPCVDLIPVENLRVDPAADWTDPVNTSPYVIHLMPMYAMDVKAKMASGEWREYGDGYLRSAGSTKPDSTRTAREKGRDDRYSADGKELMDYETVWVQRHIHRRDDEDWEFYTLGDFALLSSPRPLSEVVFHGKRPYVMGCCVLEAHKVYPSSIPQLGRGLSEESNEIVNQRLDNVKLTLNKKYFIKAGKQVDVAGLLRNVPGGVVSMDDPEKDVREVTTPDVTASSYEEQGRIDNDMAELLGNFSPAQVMADHGINGPARNMAMLSQSAGTLVEYLLRTYVETFVQPVLRQIVLLEQEYETDMTVLALAAKKAEAFQKYGVNEQSDALLAGELTLSVNVGMGATDPMMKLQKFLAGITAYAGMLQKPTPGLNMAEVGKEIFGHLGYNDGRRFFTGDNPETALLQQQLQQAQAIISQLQNKLNEKMMGHKVKVDTVLHQDDTKKQIAVMHEEAENLRNVVTHQRAMAEAEKARNHELMIRALDHRNESNVIRMTPRPMSAGSQKG